MDLDIIPLKNIYFFSLVTVSRHIGPNQKMVVGSVAVEISLVSVGNLHYDYWVPGCYVVGLSMVYWSFEG